MESDINLTYRSDTDPMSFPDKDKCGNGCEWNKILISKRKQVFCCYFSFRKKAVEKAFRFPILNFCKYFPAVFSRSQVLASQATLKNSKMFAKVAFLCCRRSCSLSPAPLTGGTSSWVLGLWDMGTHRLGFPSVATIQSFQKSHQPRFPCRGFGCRRSPVVPFRMESLEKGPGQQRNPRQRGPCLGMELEPLPFPLLNTGLLGAPYGHGAGYGLGYGAALNAVSTQKTAINHVAPVAPRVAVAAAPVVGPWNPANGLVGGYGIASNGVVAGNGILANGLIAGHGIRSAPLAISTGLLGAPYGLGSGYGLGYGAAINAASTQKSVINHVAPVAPRVALAAAPVAVANHGILANGLVAGAPLGIVGHGIAAGPLSIGSGLHGIPVGLSLGKAHY
ncbi:hypothetical protein TNIN_500191 [Trichonephila inaurata madagascariensis]|uniref:Uncharacterized protein n=1 Tax=Trichonephila inaurata madagascariensis TaxID=2747483 RepID=A0A8X6WYI9_9ARAC|nr:hypothetical protein TNIN_500191 [Trichonephila inaurata madagascariensis]